jgi:transketolase
VPDRCVHLAAGIGQRGVRTRQDWTKLFTAYRAQYPDLANQIDQVQGPELPDGWDCNLPSFPVEPKGLARREASGMAPERARTEHPVVTRQLGRPRPIKQKPR